MFKKILVPLDGSPTSEQAVGLAICVAKNNGAHITLMQAVSDTDAIWGSAYEPVAAGTTAEIVQARVIEAGNYLDKMAHLVMTYGVDAVDTRVLQGVAIDAITTAASDGYDLIVMNTHGRTGLARTVLGSVAMAVVHDSHLPVLLVNNAQAVKDYAASNYRFDNILVSLDGTRFAEQALPQAVELARATHGKLLLIKVLAEKDETEVYTAHQVGSADEDTSYVIGPASLTDYRYLEDVTGRYIPNDLAYSTIACAGKPGHDIVTIAAEHKCNLIAMTTHARRGLRRLVEGSVTEEVIANSPMPILVLRGLVAERQTESVKTAQLALSV